jgi:hypothetical protein
MRCWALLIVRMGVAYCHFGHVLLPLSSWLIANAVKWFVPNSASSHVGVIDGVLTIFSQLF